MSVSEAHPEAGALDLDDDLSPRRQARAVDLPEAGRRDGPLVEGREQPPDRRAQLALDDGGRLVGGKRRHPVLRIRCLQVIFLLGRRVQHYTDFGLRNTLIAEYESSL